MEDISSVNDQSEKAVVKNRRDFFRSFSFFLFVFFVVLSYFIGVERGKSLQNSDNSSVFSSLSGSKIFSSEKTDTRPDMKIFWEAWDSLHKKFVDRKKLDSTVLMYGAVKGMLAATDDPYTTFFDPEENKAFQEDISGSFEGIGAEIGMKNKILTIIAPLNGSPAEKAGLRSSDKILKINDESTAEMTIDQAVKKMRGPKGTDVKLTIFRDGDRETRDITVHRDTINVKSVKIEWRGEGIALVEIDQFGEETTEEFNTVVRELVSRKVRGIVLDLRDNPGGLLDSAVDIGSWMIPSGKTVVIEEDSEQKQEKLLTNGGDVLSEIPTVVLINEGSASASEILSGALRENRDNVTLVGKKSFGKGSVQELLQISGKTSLKVTVARWLTPSGKQINKEGIAPDVEIDRTNEDYEADRDPQLDKAFEIIHEKLR